MLSSREEQADRSFPSQSTTHPNTPQQPPPNNEDWEPSGDFARLTPLSTSARLAFHNLATATQLPENENLYAWHRRFIYVRKTLDNLDADVEVEAEAETEAGDDSPASSSFPVPRTTTEPVTWIRTGYWRLNMQLRPARPQLGWFIGRGRWVADQRLPESPGMVDLLLTDNATEPNMRGRHARFIHNLSTSRLLLLCEGLMKVNGKTMQKGERLELLAGDTVLGLGQCEYLFSWCQIDQDIYRQQLSSLAEEVNHRGKAPEFITPTPRMSEYLLNSKYNIHGTFATGSSCIVSAATNLQGVPFCVKKIIAKNNSVKRLVHAEVAIMQELAKREPMPDSISRLVELLEIRPTGLAGVFEYFIVTQPLIDRSLAAVISSNDPNSTRISLAAQMLQGLDFLHSNGCMHRDIKPENVLASLHPIRAVIIDFGCATWEKSSYDHLKGTIRYLAPEVLALKYASPEDTPHLSPYQYEVDIWSMGLTIYELMCRWRFTGQAMSRAVHSNILKQAHRSPRSLMMHNQVETQNLLSLVGGMMAWDPANRISARKVIEEARLHDLLESLDGTVIMQSRSPPESTRTKRVRK